jgi:hypothetical protein
MQLQNQHFQLLLNGNPIAELTFDETGHPTLNRLQAAPTKAFCAVMTLTLGEFPPTPDLVLSVQTDSPPIPKREKPPQLRELRGDFGDS